MALDADAHFTVVYAESGKLPFVYSRAKHGQKVLVAINPSRHEVGIELPADLLGAEPQALDVPEGVQFTKSGAGWKLTLGPISGAMYKLS